MADQKRGYPTPDAPSEIVMTSRCVFIPDIPEFVALISGLISQATKEYFWRAEGDMTPHQCAELMKDAIALYDASTEGECDMTCEDVLDCIETSEDIQDAISTISVQAGNSAETPSPPLLPPAQTEGQLLPEDYTCDNDHLFGMSRFIVNSLHAGFVQLLQQLESATSQEELLIDLADNFEGISWATAIAEFVGWVQEELMTQYDTAWSDTVYDELSCDLFCVFKENCLVSLDNIALAYESAIEESFSLPVALDAIDDLYQWWDSLDYETAVAKSIVASAHWAVIKMLSFGTWALRYTAGIRSLKQVIALATNDTDPDWSILCEDCPELYCKQYGNGNDWLSWVVQPARPYGDVVGDTWVSEFGGASVGISNAERLQIQVETPTSNPFNLKIVDLYFDVVGTLGTSPSFFLTIQNNGSSVSIHSTGISVGTNQHAQFTMDVDFDKILVSWVTATADEEQLSITLKELRIQGDFPEPIATNDCIEE